MIYQVSGELLVLKKRFLGTGIIIKKKTVRIIMKKVPWYDSLVYSITISRRRVLVVN